MSVSSSDRRNWYTNLETTIGTQATDTLMDLLPLHPSSELVTRSDVHAQTQMLRGEMAELRAGLKGEMVELRVELRDDMASLEARFEQRFTELRVGTQRLITASMAANAIAVVTALLS